MSPQLPTWHNTLDLKVSMLGHISHMRNLAVTVGYPYFVWNGRIYMTERVEDTGYQVRGNFNDQIVHVPEDRIVSRIY